MADSVSAAETMAELALRALDVEREEGENMEELHILRLDRGCALLPPPVVEGRVFQRLYRYHMLPPRLQVLSDAVAVYFVTPEICTKLFTTSKWSRHPGTIGPCVRGEKIIDAIKKFLLDSQHEVSDVLDSAKQIAEALVLSGFISPMREPEHEDNIVRYVHERESYELVAPGAQQLFSGSAGTEGSIEASTELEHAVPKYQKKSVWAVTDGATRAGNVFRKPDATSSLRSFFTKVAMCGAQRREKRYYAVINKTKHHALFVFPYDYARQEISHLELHGALVKYEIGSTRASLYHGLKIWTDTNFEIIDFVSKHRQEDWLLSLLDAGAQYMESNSDHEKWMDAKASFYSLTDFDAVGREFFFEELVGKVVLVVNVASKDPEAPLQYPELVVLQKKYRDEGLCVIAFPCDQFGDDGQEFDTDTEILSYLEQAYGVRFPIMTKRDVNGPFARPPFLYLNAHLPGRFGPFTEWSFTKFLVGRNGKPFKRYERRDLPAATMEDDIKMLLGETEATGSPRSPQEPPRHEMIAEEECRAPEEMRRAGGAPFRTISE